MATRIYIVRHAERIDRVHDDAWIGDTREKREDPPLSKRGYQQAKDLGTFLKPKNISKIFVSPFQRTLQTAGLVVEATGAAMYVEHGIGECLYLKRFEGHPKLMDIEHIAREYPNVQTDYLPVYKPTYAESKGECCVRSARTVSIIANREEGNILFVTHKKPAMHLIRTLQDSEEAEQVEYAAFTEFVLKENAPRSEKGGIFIRGAYNLVMGPTTHFIDECNRPIPKAKKPAVKDNGPASPSSATGTSNKDIDL